MIFFLKVYIPVPLRTYMLACVMIGLRSNAQKCDFYGKAFMETSEHIIKFNSDKSITVEETVCTNIFML